MSSISKTVQKINFTSLQHAEALGLGQWVYKNTGTVDVAGAARWGGVVGLLAYWFVQPTFERFRPAPAEDAAAAAAAAEAAK